MAEKTSDLKNERLIKLLKSDPDQPESFYSDKVGIDRNKVGPAIWFNEPLADPSLKFKGTPTNIVKAREQGLRWERIAARTGMSVSEVQKAFEEKTGKEYKTSYTGRGRNFNGPGAKKAASKKATSKATSGRRAAKNGNAKKAPAKRGARARTRAERQAKATNPS
jgi:AraC-like DNA-binding protein